MHIYIYIYIYINQVVDIKELIGFVFQLLISFFDAVISSIKKHKINFVRLRYNNFPFICLPS